MKVFVDTNILIDYVCRREPFFLHAKAIFASLPLFLSNKDYAYEHYRVYKKLSPVLFWDVDKSQADMDKYPSFLCKEFWNMAIGVIGNYYYAIMAKIESWIFARICVHSIPNAFHIYVPFQTQERRNTDAIV